MTSERRLRYQSHSQSKVFKAFVWFCVGLALIALMWAVILFYNNPESDRHNPSSRRPNGHVQLSQPGTTPV